MEEEKKQGLSRRAFLGLGGTARAGAAVAGLAGCAPQGSADAGKAKIVRLADRWATWIVVIALTAAALTWLISGEIIRAVTILVVFCPCALVLVSHDERFLDALTATRWMFDVDCAEGGGLGDTHVRVKL